MKKKALKKKKSSENDQLTGHFQSFFIFIFFVPQTLNLKKNPVNQLIKNSGLTSSSQSPPAESMSPR